MSGGSAAYADFDAYELYCGSVALAEKARVEALLEKASARLAEVVAEYGVDEAAKSSALEEVCCNMVARRLRASSAAPLSSVSMQANGFMQTMNYASSTRVGWQLYPEDLEALGIASGGVACVSPWRRSS